MINIFINIKEAEKDFFHAALFVYLFAVRNQ